MKKVFLFILIFCSFSAFSQNVDGGATTILQNVSKKYQAFTTMQINYTYKVVKDKKTLSALTGNVIIKGNKYYISYDNQYFYCNGITMWNYQKATNEVSIFDYEESNDDMLNPAKMLNNWQKEYTAKFIREEVESGKTIQVIDLTPKVGQSYYKIRLVINKSNLNILRSSIYQKDNSIHTYYFDKFVTNAAIADSQFVFD